MTTYKIVRYRTPVLYDIEHFQTGGRKVRVEDHQILIVDDDEDILTAGKLLLNRHFTGVETCSDPSEIPERMARCDYGAILLDMNFGPGESSGAQGLKWLKTILAMDADAVVVLITAHGGVHTAVEAMKLGATDFVLKPWQNEKLVATLSSAVKLRVSRGEAAKLRAANTTMVETATEPMLGSSPAMRSMLSMLERAAPTEANVLILGENGTGKELAAHAIHGLSGRRDRTFLTVDLGAVPESLFESELFGHVKGAFTDAREDRVGRFEAATGGTLFLDEIGNIPLHLQAKLLSALEQRQITPVGSSKSIPIDVRLIAATNVPLNDLRDERRFRQDLLFRLNTVEIEIPPLRERAEDIPLIAEHYVRLYSRKYSHEEMSLSPEALSALKGYVWPGNVRALRHAVERAVILAEGNVLDAGDFTLGESDGANAGQSGTVDEELNLERLEKKAIERALTRNGYNISHAARDLGLTRAALYRRMEKHGL